MYKYLLTVSARQSLSLAEFSQPLQNSFWSFLLVMISSLDQKGADRLRASQTLLPPQVLRVQWEKCCRLLHPWSPCARPTSCVQETGLVAWPWAVVYRSKPGGGDKPPDSSAPINDFQRSLSFTAIRSSFDKMLVEMDQNTSEYSLECEIPLKFCKYLLLNEYFEANIRQY